MTHSLRNALFAVVTSLLWACGGGGLPDGGVINPDTIAPIDVKQWEGLVDAGTLRYLTELGKAQRGESADLDGDGIREILSLRSADGTQTWIQETNGGAPDFKIEKFADGRIRYWYWYGSSGQPAILDESFGSENRRVTLFDSNHDSKFERRVDELRVGDNVEATEYLDAGSTDGGPQGFIVARNWVRPASSDQGTGTCNGNSNFPSQRIFGEGSSPGFSDTPAVSCSPAQRTKLAAGLECARKRLECVGRSNPTIKKEVEAHLITDILRYGCNNPCAGALASTLGAWGINAAITNFNGPRLDSWTPEQTCTTVLHELMHAAKVSQGPSHEDGIDPIYACARYCAGCIQFGGAFSAGSFPSANMDCVRCSEDPMEKKRCGVKNELITSSKCAGLPLCHGGIGVNSLCETCQNLESKDCEGTALGVPFFNCCQTCPANAIRLNDKPCPGPIMPSDTCSTKPPECP